MLLCSALHLVSWLQHRTRLSCFGVAAHWSDLGYWVCWPKTYSYKIMLGPKKLWHKKVRPNWASNSWDIPDMNKCHQDIFFLDKCYCDSRHLLKLVPGTYFWSLVKFRSVTSDIFQIWTNVAMINIAWINVAMTVGISSWWSQESTFKVWSKSGQ